MQSSVTQGLNGMMPTIEKEYSPGSDGTESTIMGSTSGGSADSLPSLAAGQRGLVKKVSFADPAQLETHYSSHDLDWYQKNMRFAEESRHLEGAQATHAGYTKAQLDAKRLGRAVKPPRSTTETDQLFHEFLTGYLKFAGEFYPKLAHSNTSPELPFSSATRCKSAFLKSLDTHKQKEFNKLLSNNIVQNVRFNSAVKRLGSVRSALKGEVKRATKLYHDIAHLDPALALKKINDSEGSVPDPSLDQSMRDIYQALDGETRYLDRKGDGLQAAYGEIDNDNDLLQTATEEVSYEAKQGEVSVEGRLAKGVSTGCFDRVVTRLSPKHLHELDRVVNELHRWDHILNCDVPSSARSLLTHKSNGRELLRSVQELLEALMPMLEWFPSWTEQPLMRSTVA